VPATPTTTNVLEQVLFDWVAPASNGLVITSYSIMIRQSDNQYSEILDYCNGALASIVTATQCTIPLSSLTAAPFSLVLDDTINFEVQATNAYGDSGYSEIGGGALIQLVPYAPVDVIVDPANTSATQISFTWNDGSSDGGAAVIDYSIYYDQSTSTWIELDNAIAIKSYTTSITLIEGHTYAFKVKARNSVGYGELSSEVSILAAQIPEQPSAPTTTIDGDDVVITWDLPDINGSPITAYTITIRESD
jgi:hypothetical protein